MPKDPCDTYRQLLEQRRAETAEKRLKGLMAMAMLELESTRTTKEEVPAFRAAVVVRWITALMCLSIVIFSMMRFIMSR